MATIDPNLFQNTEEENELNNNNLIIVTDFVFRTPLLFLIIIGVTSIILLIAIVGYRIQRSRYYYGYYDGEEDERLISSQNGFPCLKKTPTYYQWNRTPPSCQKNSSSPISSEKKSWEQRRNVLLKKYSAIQPDEENE